MLHVTHSNLSKSMEGLTVGTMGPTIWYVGSQGAELWLMLLPIFSQRDRLHCRGMVTAVSMQHWLF